MDGAHRALISWLTRVFRKPGFWLILVLLVLFRIAQEALRNVWRHAEATRAEVIVEFGKKKTRITVNDNGKGFNLPSTVGDLARDGKLGLAGMQERARLLGGTLMVQSQLGRGTSITVELPT